MNDLIFNQFGWKTADPKADHMYTLPAILKLIPRGKMKILDTGCGNGFIASRLSELGHEVCGIDVSRDGIEISRKAYQNIRFEVFSVYDDLRSIVEEVDVVLSAEVIEHLYYPKSFLKNIYSSIRPGGCLIITTPYHGYIKNLALSLFNYWDKHHTADWEGGHIKFFSETTLSRLLKECGFTAIIFKNAGRVRWLWKSMVCRARKIK